MMKVNFIATNQQVSADADQKILVIARKNKIDIRFGCASARCGTCAVKVDPTNAFKPMLAEEMFLLGRMGLSKAGDVRLACQARATGSTDATVDISFQNTYSPDDENSN